MARQNMRLGVKRQGQLAWAAGTVVPMAALCAAVMPLSASGAVVNWASAVSGTASTAARWSPAAVPAATDDLVFNATAGAQAYTVTFDATTASSRTISFQEDTVTLTMSSPHTTTNGVAIADVPGDLSTVTLSGGTWSCGPSGFVNIGDAGTTTGTFNVTGSTAHFAVLGTSDLYVGNNGHGTLNVTATGDVTCNDLMHVGQGSAGIGSLTVSGFSAAVPFGSSQLFVNGAGESRWGNGGDATVNIANGGQASFAGSLVVANLSTSVTNVTVGGAGFITGATLDVSGDLSIGRNPTAAIVPGTGTVTVNSDGNVLVGGTLHVGDDPDGGTGTLNINSGALVEAASVVDGAFGTINHGAGTLRINGGTYTGHADPLVVTGTGSPTLHLTGAVNKTLTPAGAVALIVGDDTGAGTFSGNLLIDAGADLNAGNADINVGDDAGTTGTITVSGAGSTLTANGVNSDIRVGFNGTGNLEVSDGGSCDFRNLLVPGIDTGVGLVDVSGAGSTLTTQFLAIDQTLGTGHGIVQVQTGGTINVTDPGSSTNIRNTGRLSIANVSTFNTPGTVTVAAGGELFLGGQLHNAALVDVSGRLASNGSSGAALIDAPVRVRSGGTVEAVVSDLTMGKASLPGAVAFDGGSTLTVGAGRTCTLLNATLGLNVQMLGVLDMQGGTLVCDALVDMALAPLSNQITGFGTIDSNIRTRNSEVCNPTGTGLVFERTVTLNNGFNANGTAIRFGPNSLVGEFGSHTMNCKVTADVGSVMRPAGGNADAFGPITMGDGTITGVTLNGTVHMGTNGSAIFNDVDGVEIGPLLDMNGGSISCTGGFNVATGDVLRGHGTVNVGTGPDSLIILNNGIIDPDAYFSAEDEYRGISSFFVSGGYIQQAGSRYLCEIAGFNNEFQPLNDKIQAGPVALAGTLDVSLIDGYVPQTCHEFTILTYTSRTGAWTNIIQPPGANVGVRYEATRAVLFFNSVGCDSIDFNQDGLFPDTADIDDFLSVFSGGACSTGTCNDIDFNNDCLLPDTTDIDALLSVFSGGPCL